ncbi:MAG: DinB family protein [Bacteroidetes bacterium]|nr:DinB family protein [Bacteroidota bacterium]
MEQAKWFDRKFDFSFTQNIFPSIIERMRGTPARLEEKVDSISNNIAVAKGNGGWSVKENIGHLIDLEPLWIGRLEDIINKESHLRVADLTNKKTDEANHNARNLNDLLQEFRLVRKNTIQRLEALTEEQIYLTSLHPRLKTPMRMMDHFLFVAEHDDHHLAKISEIIQLLKK